MARITMPQLGETVTSGTVTRWFKAVGDRVALDEPLLEVSTDKVDTEIPSAAAGIVTELLVAEGETVPVGALLAVIEDVDAPAAPTAASPNGDGQAVVADRRAIRTVLEAGDDLHGPIRLPTPRAPGAQRPATRDAAHAARRRGGPQVRDDEVVRIPHTTIRRTIAANLTASLHTAAHTLVVAEVDFHAVDRVRRSVGEPWRRRAGFGLTYLPFVARSVCDALARFPRLNAEFEPDDLVVHSRIHLGIAVDLDHEGLVVPVVRDAGALRLAPLAEAIHEVGDAARARRLGADDLHGATFTLTNAGAHGTFVTAPIINPPQVAILSTDGVRPRPVAVPDAEGGHGIAVHPVGNLALSFDHRAVDGAYASAFLDAVRRQLEDHDWASELPGLVGGAGSGPAPAGAAAEVGHG